jgi:hypothetical protein
MALSVVPVSPREAVAFIALWHRHNKPPRGCKFSLGVADDLGVLRGVAMVGRPVARLYDDGLTLEVNRTSTDGARNANSMMYGAAWRAARALGYCRLVTYTHADYSGPVCPAPCAHWSCLAVRVGESGASLRAAGWRIVAQRTPHHGWDRPARPRVDSGGELIPRTLWEATA